MKFKKIIPYCIFGSMAILSPKVSRAQLSEFVDPSKQIALASNVDKNFAVSYNTETFLNMKAKNLCDFYIDRMIDAQKKLAPMMGKRGYTTAVLRELPGAPVGLHCVYGQYTHFIRALKEMGDTLTVIPQSASRKCTAFKDIMRKLYSEKNGYHNCIHEGVMHQSDAAYEESLEKYLKSKDITFSSPKFADYVQEFAKHNWSVESLAPGAMLVVPRTRGSNTKFHMIMFLGRGRIENGNFIPDNNGKYVYVGHNREKIGYLFESYDTSNVFASNTRQIVRTKYAQELNKINNMTREELIAYITKDSDINVQDLSKLSISNLNKIARDKYFDKFIPKQKVPSNTLVAQNTYNLRNALYKNMNQYTL